MSELHRNTHPEFSGRWHEIADDQSAQEAYYQDCINCLRAEVAQLFGEHSSESDVDWLYFTFKNNPVHPDHSGSGSDLTVVRFKTIAHDSAGNVIYKPNIRIVYAEEFKVDGKRDFFTIDVTLDEENDAQYLVGGFLLSAETDLRRTAAPIMYVENGVLHASVNFCAFTPNLIVNPEEDNRIFPFGHFSIPSDRQGAVDVAAHLISFAKGAQPSHRGDKLLFASFT